MESKQSAQSNSLQVCRTPPSDAFGILIPPNVEFQLEGITRGHKLVQKYRVIF